MDAAKFPPLGSLSIEQAEEQSELGSLDSIIEAVAYYKEVDRVSRRGTLVMRATLSALIDLLIEKEILSREEVMRSSFKWYHITALLEKEAEAQDQSQTGG